MNKQEVIDKQALIDELMKIPGVGSNSDALKTIKRFPSYKPQKVKVPKCVGELLDYYRNSTDVELWALLITFKDWYYRKDKAGEDENAIDWLVKHPEKYMRAWLDGYEVEEEPKWVVNEGDLVIRKGEHEAKVYFVESVDEDGILLVNGIKDEFFTDGPERAADEETLSYFLWEFSIVGKEREFGSRESGGVRNAKQEKHHGDHTRPSR